VIARAPVVLRQARSLARVSARGARVYGASPLAIARRARLLRTRQGYEYEEALTEGLLDPALSEAQCALHASRHVTVEAQRRLNPEATNGLTGDKATFYGYCEAIGLPIPRLYGVVDVRGWAGSSHTGRVVSGAAGFADFVSHDLPEVSVAKPTDGYHGRGVRVLRRRGPGFEGAPTPAALLQALRADPEFSVWVFQEHLRNHPAVAAIGGDETLHTVRVVSLVSRAGDAEVLYAVLKLGLAGGDADNFEGGRSGNGLAEIDLGSGRLGEVKLAREDGCGFVYASDAPGTGARVEGAVLPAWRETLALVRGAARAFAPARTLGWDVALTPSGPVLVELNAFWWPRSSPDQGRLLQRLATA
jgi:hypothetical protein